MQSRVKIEFGVGDQDPSRVHGIQPYAAEDVADLFAERESCAVIVLDAVRTFWEKATALHGFVHEAEAIEIDSSVKEKWNAGEQSRHC